MSEYKTGDVIIFDVTAGGHILPGVLRERLGARTFLRWVKLDGYEAEIIADHIGPKPMQYSIRFIDTYVIRGISDAYFLGTVQQQKQVTPHGGHPEYDPDDGPVEPEKETSAAATAVYDEYGPACTEMPVYCTVCIDDGQPAAKIKEDENGFMCCTNCGASYGRLKKPEAPDGKA